MRSDAAKWTAWGLFLVILTTASWWVLGRDPDQSVLTREVPVTVTAFHEEVRGGRAPMTGYRLDYTYRVDDRDHRARSWVVRGSWEPGMTISACVDPARTEVHTLHVQRHVPCGEARAPVGVVTAGGG